MKLFRSVVLATALSLPLAAGAQTSNTKSTTDDTAQEMRQMMKTALELFSSMIGPMTEFSKEIQAKLPAQPSPQAKAAEATSLINEQARQTAAFKRQLFLELVRQGFTEQQAMQIMLATKAPAAASQ